MLKHNGGIVALVALGLFLTLFGFLPLLGFLAFLFLLKLRLSFLIRAVHQTSQTRKRIALGWLHFCVTCHVVYLVGGMNLRWPALISGMMALLRCL